MENPYLDYVRRVGYLSPQWYDSTLPATSLNVKKMVFTISDLVGQMNSVMGADGGAATSDENKNDDDEVRGFELHTRMPDGSYRPTQSNELAAVDFQSKMKQAAISIVGLDGRQKLEWASRQRRMGNELFAAGEYKEAMDVYLTCLVAVDRRRGGGASSSSSSLLDDDGNNNSIFDRMEEEIQLPVLLNLALCAMKMGMLSKAEKFCNHAIDETSCGKFSPKAYFRRGRVRLLMGHYVDAESDLDVALGLLQRLYDDFEEEDRPFVSSDQNGEMTTTPCDVIAKRKAEIEIEQMVILREKERLHSLVMQAERTKKVQKKAMERLFGGLSSHLNNDGGDPFVESSLYPEKKGLSRRRTRNIDVCNNESTHNNKTKDKLQPQPTYFRWYMCTIGRCVQKLLDLIGEAEEDDDDSMLYLANTCSFKSEKVA